MSKELRVQQYNEGEVRVSHQNLAEFLELRQGDVRDLIERHIGDFEQISQCPFQTENAKVGFGERAVKVYYLDADQANFLVTLTKPTEASIPLKLNVVLAFKEAKKALASTSLPTNVEAHLTERALAAEELKKEWSPMNEMLLGLGYSEGARRAEFLETATRKEAERNVELLSPYMKQQMIAGITLLADKSKEGHAALVPLGGMGVKPTILAKKLVVRPTEVNKAFVRLGWAAPVGDGLYMPCQPGLKYCYTKKCSKGVYKDHEVIDTWNEALVWPHLKRELLSLLPVTV